MNSAAFPQTPDEMLSLKRSCAIAWDILKAVVKVVEPGVVLSDLDAIARRMLKEAGAESAFEGYENFPGVLCCSVNSAAVHGVPNAQRLQEGDIVGLDFGAIVNGWYSDTAMTVVVGHVTAEAQKLLSVAQEALRLGIAQARAGNRVGDISYAIQQYVEKEGFQIIRDLAGHGVGRSLHEPPQVPNFGGRSSGPKLLEGMVLAIEPIISRTSQRVRKGADGFGYETDDNSLAAHFEHTILVTTGEPEILTA